MWHPFDELLCVGTTHRSDACKWAFVAAQAFALMADAEQFKKIGRRENNDRAPQLHCARANCAALRVDLGESVKKISDYVFSNAWAIGPLKSYEKYVVVADLGELKRGDIVKFIGFADVDNHFGIFVFTDKDGRVLEVSGDFCGLSCLACFSSALSKPP
jgi:hypothetical protein